MDYTSILFANSDLFSTTFLSFTGTVIFIYAILNLYESESIGLSNLVWLSLPSIYFASFFLSTIWVFIPLLVVSLYVYFLIYLQIRILIAEHESSELIKKIYGKDLSVDIFPKISGGLALLSAGLAVSVFNFILGSLVAVLLLSFFFYSMVYETNEEKLKKSITTFFTSSVVFVLLILSGLVSHIASLDQFTQLDALNFGSFLIVLPLGIIDLFAVYTLAAIKSEGSLIEHTLNLHKFFILSMVSIGLLTSDLSLLLDLASNGEVKKLANWSLRTPVYLTVIAYITAAREITFLKYVGKSTSQEIKKNSRRRLARYDIPSKATDYISKGISNSFYRLKSELYP